MYPFGLEAERALAEHALRLERRTHDTLLAEARRAVRARSGRSGRHPSKQPFLQAMASGLRAASVWLDALATRLEPAVAGDRMEAARQPLGRRSYTSAELAE